MDIPIENCVSAKVYKPDPTKKFFLIAVIVALYAVVLPFAYFTAGEPRQAAIIRAQEIEDEKWNADISDLSDKSENETSTSSQFSSFGRKGGGSSDSAISDEEFESLPFQYSTVDSPAPSKVPSLP